MLLRSFQLEDYDRGVDLWTRAGLFLSPSDTREGLARKLERDADLFVVAESGDGIVGVVMGCYGVRHVQLDMMRPSRNVPSLVK